MGSKDNSWQRGPVPGRSVAAMLGFAAAVTGIGAGCSTAGTEGSASAATSSAEIIVDIKSPTVPPTAIVSKTVTVSGSVTTKSGASVSAMKITAGEQAGACTRTGTTFSCTFATDTKQKDPKKPTEESFVFKCGTSVSLVVTAEGKPTGTVGQGSVDVEIDNCGPTLALTDPKKEKLDGRIYIGKFDVIGSVTEKNFGSARLTIRLAQDGAEEQELLKMSKAGGFKQTIDRRFDGTADWVVALESTDTVGNVSRVEATVRVVRQPSFLGNSDEADKFSQPIHDFVINQFDTEDDLLDALVATPDGLVLRRGLPKSADDAGHRGAFDPLEPDFALDATGAVLLGKDGKAVDNAELRNALYRVPLGNVKRLFVHDLDGDEDLDVVALGLDPVTGPTAWALLAWDRKVKTKDGEKSVLSFKLLDKRTLPEAPLSAAFADLDLDKAMDLIVGAKSDNFGLTVVRLEPEPTCKAKKTDVAVTCAGLDLTAITIGTIFKELEQPVVNKGVTQVTSITVDDYYKDDKSLPDVCVGEGNRPVVSCYRNSGTEGRLEQAQDGLVLPDYTDTTLIVPVEWTAPGKNDGPDLIVGTTKGLRWLKGKHDGTFAYEPGAYRQIIGVDATAVHVAPIGPNKTPYLVVTAAAREVTVLPVLPADDSHAKMCFRSWVLGGAVLAAQSVDLDADGTRDLVSIDSAPSGVNVAWGKVDGEYEAPNAYHLCARPENTNVLAPSELAEFDFVDLGTDKFPELLMIGKASWSLQPASQGTCVLEGGALVHKPVWPISIYMNANKKLSPIPRGAEFAPYAHAAQSGASADCGQGTISSFGSVSALKTVDLTDDKIVDLALARDNAEYEIGADAEPAAGCGPCQWADTNEVDNLFGQESPTAPAEGEPDLPKQLCCKNYFAGDEKKTKPLSGYGSGAPLKRASLLLFQGTDKDPFGVGPTCSVLQPCVVKPQVALAAGRNPIGIAAGDFDSDKKIDLATVMKSDGSVSHEKQQYMEARVRYFNSALAGGKLTVQTFKHVPQKDQWKWIDPKSGMWAKNVDVNYRAVGPDPFDVCVAPWGPGLKLPSVFTVNRKLGHVSVVRSVGNLGTDVAKEFVIGDAAQTCVCDDFDGVSWLDLLCALKSNIGFIRGDGNWFKPKQTLTEDVQADVGALLSVDVNKDDVPDIAYIDRKTAVVEFYLGTGKATFLHYEGKLRTANLPDALARADVDGDGCFDLAVRSKMSVTLLRNRLCAKLGTP